MTATQPTTTKTSSKTSSKTSKTPARPVTAVLLELAYLMHTTKVVGVRETPTHSKGSDRSM